MLSHANILATVETAHNAIPPQEHRLVSLLPLSHLIEQAIALFYALTVGADILYVRSRNPRVIFEAIRDHRVTTMVVVPQVLDLFWSAIEREVDKTGRRATFDRLRGIARHLPYGARRLLFRRVHAQLGGGLNLFVCAAAFLPPVAPAGLGGPRRRRHAGLRRDRVRAGQRDLEDRPRPRDRRPDDPAGRGQAGRGRRDPRQRARPSSRGYWRDPEATAAAFTTDGWYRTGDIGRHDDAGHLILMGRIKDIIVLPNGLNVYPEDIENALRTAGIRDSVVIETQPGRIEAVVLAPGEAVVPRGGDVPGQGVEPPSIATPPSFGPRSMRPSSGPTRRLGDEPAGRRLAAVARRRLPADPHPQGEARPDPGLGRRRAAAADRRRSRSGPRPRASAGAGSGLAGDRDLDPERRRAWPPTVGRHPAPARRPSRPRVEDERGADLAHHERASFGNWTRPGPDAR